MAPSGNGRRLLLREDAMEKRPIGNTGLSVTPIGFGTAALGGMPDTYGYARKLADTVSPGSLRETKSQIYTDLHRDVGAAVRDADALLEQMTTEADYREAVSAFMEKRPPKWSGR